MGLRKRTMTMRAVGVAAAVAFIVGAVPLAMAAPPTQVSPGPTPPSSAIPGAWTNTSTERFDGDIPGRIMHMSPMTGSLSVLSDKRDVLQVELAEGQRAYFRALTTSGSLDVRMRLFAPGSTSVLTDTPLLAIPDVGGGHRLIYEVPTGMAGTYYLELYAYTGAGEYRVFGPEENDSMPGVEIDAPELGVWNIQDAGEVNGDTLDVYRTHLEVGRVYEFNVSAKSNDGNFEFALYPPGTQDPVADPASMPATGWRSKSLRYIPTTAGDYYIVVKWTHEEDDYRLSGPGSPFGLEAHAFPFGNFSGHPDEALFKSVFALPPGPLTLGERMFYEGTFKGSYGGGQCYGIAVVAGMFYRNHFGASPGDFEPGAQYARDIPQDTRGGAQDLDEAIERYISKYHYFQKDKAIRSTTTSFGPNGSMSGWLRIISEMGYGWEDPYILSFRGHRADGGSWGHAVNMNGVRWTRPDDQILLSMYDNNAPSLNRFYTTDAVNFDAQGYSDVYCGYMRPVSPNEKISIPKLWSEISLAAVSVALQDDVSLLHTDDLGRRTGQLDAMEIAEIPDSERIELLTGNLDPEWREPVEYYLPPRQEYSVDVRRATAGEITYNLFDGDQAMALEIPETGPDTAWRVATNLRQHGLQVSALSASPQEASVQLVREPGDTSRMLEVSGMALGGTPSDAIGVFGPPAALAMTSDPQAETFGVTLSGADQIVNLTLSDVVGRKVLTTTLEGVEASADVSHTIEVWDWRKLEKSPVFVVGHLPDGTDEVVAYQVTKQNFGAMVGEMRQQGLLGRQLAAEIVRLRSRGAAPGALEDVLDSAVVKGQIESDDADRIVAAAAALDG